MFVNKHFIILGVHISKSKRCDNAKPSTYYFYVKTKLSVDFRICISVPLRKGYILYFPSTHSMYYGTNSVHFWDPLFGIIFVGVLNVANQNLNLKSNLTL